LCGFQGNTNVENVNLTGKTALITGGTNGIGKAAAHALAKMGATVVITARSREKAVATLAEIRTSTGNQNVEAIFGDLSSMGQVRQMATDFLAKYPRLDILINNAGGIFDKPELTEDGFERTFAVNHLSHFLLTNLLLDTMKETAKTADASDVRIINVSSNAYMFVRGMQFDDLSFQKGGFSPMKAYGQSKLANILFTDALTRRLKGTGITANAMHPGAVKTGFGKTSTSLLTKFIGFMISMMGVTAEQGADTVVWLATSPEVANVSGKYFFKRKELTLNTFGGDAAAADRLWTLSEQMVNLATETVLE
jgi:NAD(P)-dependent dehydrogenase (short-subunit alcohol dehydrogenase family)